MAFLCPSQVAPLTMLRSKPFALNGSRDAIAGKRQRRRGRGAVALVPNRHLGDLASDPNHHQTLLVKCPETGQQKSSPWWMLDPSDTCQCASQKAPSQRLCGPAGLRQSRRSSGRPSIGCTGLTKNVSLNPSVISHRQSLRHYTSVVSRNVQQSYD
jgi:hypothetical protein